MVGSAMAWSRLGSSRVCASPGLFRQFFTIARTRETLCHLIEEKEKEKKEKEEEEEEEEEEEKEKKKKRKKMPIFDFFKVRFLGFYKAERKSEDVFVLRRVRAFH